jgi:hypothetical protein
VSRSSRLQKGPRVDGAEPDRLHRADRPELPALPAHHVSVRRCAAPWADAAAALAGRDAAVAARARAVRKPLAAIPAGGVGRGPRARGALPPAHAAADPGAHHARLRAPGGGDPGHPGRPDDADLDRHRLRQDRVLPLPDREPVPGAPGRRRRAGHQRGDRLPDERAGGGPAGTAALAPGRDRDSLRDVRGEDPGAGERGGRHPAAGGGVARGLRGAAGRGAPGEAERDGVPAGGGLLARGDAHARPPAPHPPDERQAARAPPDTPARRGALRERPARLPRVRRGAHLHGGAGGGDGVSRAPAARVLRARGAGHGVRSRRRPRSSTGRTRRRRGISPRGSSGCRATRWRRSGRRTSRRSGAAGAWSRLRRPATRRRS